MYGRAKRRCTTPNGGPRPGPVAKGPAAVELYAHTGDAEADFDAFENENVAAANAAVVAQHLAIATRQWAKPSA
jgi:hypothetical protein